jgi:hypothetical protein
MKTAKCFARTNNILSNYISIGIKTQSRPVSTYTHICTQTNAIKDGSLLGFSACSVFEVDRRFRGAYGIHHTGDDDVLPLLCKNFLAVNM